MKRGRKIALIGMGMMAGSLARAIKSRALCDDIAAFDRDDNQIKDALRLGLIDQAGTMASVLARADLVVLCVPVGSMAAVAAAMAPHLEPRTLVTDIGSTKVSVVRDVAGHFDHVRFVPAHPIAGSEKSGAANFRDELFVGKWCILTPAPTADAAAVQDVEQFWRALGSKIKYMTPDHHDEVFALTSHLPHAVTYAMTTAARHAEEQRVPEATHYYGGSFNSMIRLAGSDPVMWRDVFLHNREPVLASLAHMKVQLTALETLIRDQDGAGLKTYFEDAKDFYHKIIGQGVVP